MTAAPRPNPEKIERSSEYAGTISLEDVRLVEKVLAGHNEAFAEIVRKYGDRVFNTCWRICGHLEDARDLTQETFVRAFESLHRFERKSGLYTWLYRVAVNLAITQYRRGARRKTVSLDQASDGCEGADRLSERLPAPAEDEATESARDTELQAVVVREMQQLDADHRAVIVLRDMDGLDYHQIAEILGIPPGTVKSRLHRARLALREALAPKLRRAGWDEECDGS